MQSQSAGGYASLLVLAVLILLAGLLYAWAGPYAYLAERQAKTVDRWNEERRLQDEAAALAADMAERSDGKTEGLLAFEVPANARLVDCGGRVNPLWVRKQFFAESPLGELLKKGTPDDLQVFRAKEELPTDLEGYEDFFDQGDLAAYFTLDTPLNVNTVDEFVFERIMAEALGDSGAGTSWRERLRALRLQNKSIKSEDELAAWFGGVWDRAARFATVVPDWNVNTLDPRILRSLLAYRGFGLASPEAVFQSIMSIRAQRFVKSEDLRNLVRLDATNPFWYCLGTESATWRLELRGEGEKSLVAILAAARTSESGSKLKIVETRFVHG